jgi:hypothetical protein
MNFIAETYAMIIDVFVSKPYGDNTHKHEHPRARD